MTTELESVPEGVDTEAAPPPVDVGKAARQGGVWAIAGYAFSKVTGFASSIVLARFLMPEHFGLIAMVNTLTALVQLLGYWGVHAVVMYEREHHEDYANTGWWLDVIMGVVLFGLANAAAPIAVQWYSEPQVQLIIFVVSFNYIINPLGAMMDTLLRREFRFRESTRINLTYGLTVSLMTIALAVLGAGVWSFVFPSLAGGVVAAALRWKASTFRPTRPVRWDLTPRIFGFGKHLFGASLVDYVNQNVDYVLVGGLLNKTQLGLYLFAYNLGTWIVANISGVITGIIFPTVTSVRDDRERALRLFLRLAQMISIVGFPLVALQWAITPLYLGSIYGTKWLPCVTAFRLIALYGIGRAVCQPALTLISAMGRPDVNLKISAATCPVLIAAVYLGTSGGINGVALATAIAHGALVWLYVAIPFRILGWDIKRFLVALCPAFVCSVLALTATGAVYCAVGSPSVSLGSLGLLILLFGAMYVGSMLALFRQVAVSAAKMVFASVREARE